MIATIALLLAGPTAPATYRLDDAPPAASETPVARDRVYQGNYGYEQGGGRRFSVALPEGNWRVTVTLGGKRLASTTIKAEARRLMLDRVATRAGQRMTRSFVVNTRTPALAPPPAGAPGGTAVRLKPAELASATWDDRLTLELLGDAAVTTIRIEPANVRTLYLVGDSTVTDQPSEPAASWGQMLPAMLGDRVAVANHAESGETLKSFLTGLRLDKVLSTLRPGDWLFLQFGHNDQKRQWPQTYVDAATTYRSYLRTYIAEARRRGARPVLVTSPERRNFDANGRIERTLGDYPAAVRAVAAEEAVPLIDLNAASVVRSTWPGGKSAGVQRRWQGSHAPQQLWGVAAGARGRARHAGHPRPGTERDRSAVRSCPPSAACRRDDRPEQPAQCGASGRQLNGVFALTRP